VYEDGKMRPVETILRRRERGIKVTGAGVNFAEIYCKQFF
jgi:hypothetical protein